MAEEKLQKKTENHEDLEISNVKLRIPWFKVFVLSLLISNKSPRKKPKKNTEKKNKLILKKCFF